MFTDKSDKIDAEGAQNDENPTIIEDDEDISEAVSLNITNHFASIFSKFNCLLTFCLQLSADKNSGPIKPPKDTPLERRALLSLEKQLELEHPESKFDFRVSFLIF